MAEITASSLSTQKINNIVVDKQRGDRVNVEMDADTVVRGKVSVKTPAQIKTAGEKIGRAHV